MSDNDRRASKHSLLSGSLIRLFGQVVGDLSFNLGAAGTGLPTQTKGPGLAAATAGSEEVKASREPDAGSAAQLARIYSFSYEGKLYDLARPTIFLVHGTGENAAESLQSMGIPMKPPVPMADLMVWAADQLDFSVRLDVETGPLERILLEAELGGDRAQYMGADVRMRYAGADVRLRYAGADARLRFAGADARLRYAGADARLRGGGSSD